MDNGDVLPDLDKPVTFLGATPMEWAIGFAMFIIISSFAPDKMIGRMVPFMLVGWFVTTYTVASLRKIFPDEEKGMRNYFSTMAGIPPVGIPAPAILQPIWSATLVKDLSEKTEFMQIGLQHMFPIHEENFKATDDSMYVEKDADDERKKKIEND